MKYLLKWFMLIVFGFFCFQSKLFSQTSSDTKNCGCDYFPLCKFDKSRSFKGEVWKGIDDDDKLTYYNCTNGILKVKVELFDNFEGNSLGFETFTALKYNEPKGTKWNETIDFNGTKYYYTHTILEKGISISVKEKIYKDVIKVHRIKMGASTFYEGKPLNTMQLEDKNIYYAKGIGAIEAEGAIEHLPEQSASSKKISEDNAKHPLYNLLTENIWMTEKYTTSQIFEVATFHSNGSYEFQTGKSFDDLNQKLGFWRVKDNTIEISTDNTIWKKEYDITNVEGEPTKLKSKLGTFSFFPVPEQMKK